VPAKKTRKPSSKAIRVAASESASFNRHNAIMRSGASITSRMRSALPIRLKNLSGLFAVK